jgi:large exoprotein involved in heme utilization and adhesion
VQVIGTTADGQSPTALLVDTLGAGKGGDVTINTSQLLVSDGARISAGTAGSGAGGSLLINAAESVELIGTSADGQLPSGLGAEAYGTGEAGDVAINTSQLLVSDGAAVSASTNGEGTGGSLSIKATESVEVSDALISVAAFEGSTAGNLTITTNSLTLNQGTITAETATSGAEGGANITLNGLDLLLMGNESLISANALGTANGGNITIDSKFIVATPPTGSEGSDIVANAVNGDGGRVNITTEGLFGIDFRPRRTPLNDITASSETGSAGVVSITQPNIDPSQGLAELPTNVVDAQGLIDRSCTPGGGSAFNSSFTVTGRGGLPSNPTEPLNSDAVVSGWVTLDSEAQNQDDVAIGSDRINTTTQPIVEAQGWVRTADGQVILVAQAPTVTPQTPWLTSPSCQDVQATTN